MKAKLLLSTAPLATLFAVTTMVSTAAMADQPLNIEAIRCSNNGGGNGEEIFTGVEGGCEKRNFDVLTDLPGLPGQGPTDPNPQD